MPASLLLIRGLPGSGKSTKARQLVDAGQMDAHFEADMWVDYSTPYSTEKAVNAHKKCIAATKESLLQGKRVVVSNTFVRRWEMQPYFEIAAEMGINPKVIVATGSYDNIHNVPADVIEKMRVNWEE